MERVILMCRETDFSFEVMVHELPKIGSRLKIKRRVDRKIMNIYRVDAYEYATYELRGNTYDLDEEKRKKYETPLVRCEVKLSPIYYNYHHKMENIKKFCCENCTKHFFQDAVGSQSGQCGNPKSEKYGKTVYQRNICLQGFLEMKRNEAEKQEEEKKEENIPEVEIYEDK